jgi:hypothetical protein
MPYDLRTERVGIFARHADGCPSRDGKPCRCGPLGYLAGIWDWKAARWTVSPLLATTEEALGWQRAANRRADGTAVPAGAEIKPERAEEKADPSEKLFWWAFCYLGLGFVAVALALFASDVAG